MLLRAVEAWEDEVLEQLDGPEHVVVDAALEPMELFEPIQCDHGSCAGVEHVRYRIQEREVLQVWCSGEAAEKLVQVDDPVRQSQRTTGGFATQRERASERQFCEEFGLVEETQGTVDAAAVGESILDHHAS